MDAITTSLASSLGSLPELVIRERGVCTLQFIRRRSMVATVNEMEFVTLAEPFHFDCIYCMIYMYSGKELKFKKRRKKEIEKKSVKYKHYFT